MHQKTKLMFYSSKVETDIYSRPISIKFNIELKRCSHR
jgi:hypothetical protein